MANEDTTPVVEEKKARQKYGISDTQFVDAWQASNSAQEVADRLSTLSGKNVPKAIVLARKATYAKKGVELKKMPRVNPRKMNIAALNERIKGNGEAEAEA
jgi:hypothetical protein